MRLLCNFVNVYTHASLTDILVSGSWQTELGSRRTRRLPREDPRAEVGDDVRVGVDVGPMEFKLYSRKKSDTRDRFPEFLWQAERESRQTRRHPRDDPCEDVSEDVGVGVMECQLNCSSVIIRNKQHKLFFHA